MNEYFKEVVKACNNLIESELDNMIDIIYTIKKNKGRLFFIGVGGGAGNSSHAVCDFRKLVGIESYSVTENIPELTARINDEGWNTAFSESLKSSNLCDKDGIFVFSVGGGSIEQNVSVNIIEAAKYAKSVNAKILGIVGRSKGYIAQNSDSCIIINCDNKFITPMTESFQTLIWHMLVTSPKLQSFSTKW